MSTSQRSLSCPPEHSHPLHVSGQSIIFQSCLNNLLCLLSACLILIFSLLYWNLVSGGRSFVFPSAAGPVPAPEEVLSEIVE